MAKRLPLKFYTRPDTVQIARELLGKVLVTEINGIHTAGIITETEAYVGKEDKASHSYTGRRTPRNEPMYQQGGITYVYLCYGIHYLFNIVTNIAEDPHAILIRAVEPLEGIPDMLLRRNKETVTPILTAGPGVMSTALGIDKNLNNKSLSDPEVWVEDRNIKIAPEDIIAASRVGVAYAKEHALLPYRFYIRNNPFVSKAKGL